jgi:hypothetical protein
MDGSDKPCHDEVEQTTRAEAAPHSDPLPASGERESATYFFFAS